VPSFRCPLPTRALRLRALIDRAGSADIIGTPKTENPNLRRLEKEGETDKEWQAFHFTSWDNPSLPRSELEKAKAEMDGITCRQEIMAEYVENAAALFKYTALLDLFSNTITKAADRFRTVDIAEDGSKTIFNVWEGLEQPHRAVQPAPDRRYHQPRPRTCRRVPHSLQSHRCRRYRRGCGHRVLTPPYRHGRLQIELQRH
jgi:hypothetical protein